MNMQIYSVSLKFFSQKCLLLGILLYELLHHVNAFSLSTRNQNFHSQPVKFESVRLPHRIIRSSCSKITCKDDEYCDPHDNYCRSCERLCQGAGMSQRDGGISKCEKLCPGYYHVLQSIRATISGQSALETRDASSSGKLPQTTHILLVVLLSILVVVAIISLGIKIWEVHSKRCRNQRANAGRNNAEQSPHRSRDNSPGNANRAPLVTTLEEIRPGPSGSQPFNGTTGSPVRRQEENQQGAASEKQSLLHQSKDNRRNDSAGPSISTSSRSGSMVPSSDPRPSKDTQSSTRRVCFPKEEGASATNIFQGNDPNSNAPISTEMNVIGRPTEQNSMRSGGDTALEETV